MGTSDTPAKVISADPMGGDLIVYFSDGTSVLYRSDFLYSVRGDDSNIAMPNDVGKENDGEP